MKENIIDLKKIILKTVHSKKEGHIPSAFSILDIMFALYDRVLRIDPKNPNAPDRDRFILSKGHASIGLFAILANKGFFDFSEFENFAAYDSKLGGHPDCNKVPGVEASTGSLGHGMPIAVGVALGEKIKKSDVKVYTIIGDGESNEGTIWEAALLAGHHKLDNLTCIVDYNHSTDPAIKVHDFTEKFKAFGWESFEADGHDQEALYQAFMKDPGGRPKAIIANTVKGRGIKKIESDMLAWHHKMPNDEELDEFLGELNNRG
ncbi:MAG: transketolase [Patescibacteria group bacterium]|jgi:transketolase